MKGETLPPSPRTTLVILLGACEWPYFPDFEKSEAFSNSVSDLEAYFLDPQLFNLPRENLLNLFDTSQSPDDIDIEIGQFLDKRMSDLSESGLSVTDLLIYFTGHAGFAEGSSSLYLAIRRTRQVNQIASSIPIVSLAHTIREKARYLRHVIILDCCFAGAALAIFQGRGAAQATIAQTINAFRVHSKRTGVPQRGTSLLCSSGSKAPSMTRHGEKYTVFSSALLHVLHNGAAFQERKMSLYTVGNLIEDFLYSHYGDEVPRPEVHSPDQSCGDVATLPFFPNIARMRAQLSNSTRSRQAGETKYGEKNHNGKVEFERIEPRDLQSIPVIAQALDYQWIPRSLLQKVIQTGYLTARIERQRVKLARAEYIRALLNSKQLVIDLPHIYNNPVLYQDFLRQGQHREDFKALLDSAAIVPYLEKVRSPEEHPTETYYDMHYLGFAAWRELCLETHMQCLRFSWDDRENWEQVRANLSHRFNRFAAGILAGDMDTYIRDLGLDERARSNLRQRFREVANLCGDFQSQDKLATRSDLYRVFVTTGDNPADRRYDPDKPFAAEIKQLLDLSYNSNLPDALGGYLLTPPDSLPRAALQEWQKAEGGSEPITGEELVKRLQRTVFDLAQQGHRGIKSMDVLTLQDVLQIRDTDEWLGYIKNTETLLANPLAFADGGIAKVYESYCQVVGQMTHLVQRRDASQIAKWEPHIWIIFNIAGALLIYKLTSAGSTYELAGSISSAVSRAATPIVGKLIIRGSEKRRQADMTNSIDFMKCKMYDGKTQWREIERIVSKLPSFQKMQWVPPQDTPTINYEDIEY